jgi:UDPglucose 6-dehydrogenase
MRIGVVGLWHLGSVTAACLGSHFEVIGYDSDAKIVSALSEGRPPLFEPGLEDLVRAGLASGNLRFTARAEELGAAEIIWVTHDTPVDDDDRAIVDPVLQEVIALFPVLGPRALVLISAQLPVGSTRRLEQAYIEAFPQGDATFAYSPENLRLGSAIDAFRKPERIVAGVRSFADRKRLEPVLGAFTDRLEWMGVESAEMTKHAINSFLATSVAFINEIAGLCELVGADAREVERGMKSEGRIGPRARLKPGGPFAGGTLARDITYVEAIGERTGRPTVLVSAVRASNEAHKHWPRRRLTETLGDLTDKRIVILGLTYKPGTDTLRRSSALELCRWLLEQRARVAAFDPLITDPFLPALQGIELARSTEEALVGASAAVIATEWPEFGQMSASVFLENMLAPPTVLDANGLLQRTLGEEARIRYLTVGKP